MNDQAQEVINYLINEVIRRKGLDLDEETRLVSSGLIDSLALVDVLFKLEDVTGMRIPAGKVQPQDMDTVRLMFETAARVGRPRK